MTKKGIIFTDVDGTLVFHHKFHHIQIKKTNPDKTVLVVDPLIREEFQALDVSVGDILVYLDQETKRLAERVREHYWIYFTTGATEVTMKIRLENLDFADGYILEHGARILDREFNEDQAWAERFMWHEEAVLEIKDSLEKLDWRIVDQGRRTFIQVKAFENPHRSIDEFNDLCENVNMPPGFAKTFNLGNLTLMPDNASKGLAVEYLLESKYKHLHHTIAIGDDINDLSFMEKCRQVFVLGSSVPEVKERAVKEKWTVSKAPHFAGINEIFMMILKASAE
jgi:hydroxymethylpyrimidine pyrophosphatase-like HAD family hydrolase